LKEKNKEFLRNNKAAGDEAASIKEISGIGESSMLRSRKTSSEEISANLFKQPALAFA